MTVDQAIAFIEEMARYFHKMSVTTDEDMTFWASKNNAESCEKIAELLRSMKNENSLQV
jgi:hypothetical protein